jgi:hypothetical protein
LPDEPLHSNYNLIYPSINKYININKTNFNHTITEFIHLSIEDELIGIYQSIGPYSGSVEIYKDNALIETQHIWDIWCYYERDTFKIKIDKPGNYCIKLIRYPLDQSKCKVQHQWSVFQPVLHIKDIYHTQNLSINDYK